jgi:hypothetical protein
MIRMVRALFPCALALAVVLWLGTDADARRKKHHRSHDHHAKHQKHEKKKHRTSKARGGDNMPPGWTWPPSPEMKAMGEECLARLDNLGIQWEPAEATMKVATPVIVPSMEFAGLKLIPTFRKPPFVMDCHLALGLAIYGQRLYDIGVRELHFSRIHGYTQVRVNGQTLSALSRHALGVAMDVYSFVDVDGNEAIVEHDYLTGNQLLLDVERVLNDSGGFRTVLTPRNDPASHHDHFHLEIKVEYTPPTTKKLS